MVWEDCATIFERFRVRFGGFERAFNVFGVF